MNLWSPINKPNFGLADLISNYIGNLESHGKITFPNLRNSERLLILSDYGGEHKNAKFFCYTFLLMDFEEIKPFGFYQTKLRKEFLLERRIINYKNLNDKIRAKALYPFLNLSNNINGVIFSVLTHKDILSLFSFGKPDYSSEYFKSVNTIWNTKTIEKLMRIIHLIALFISGISIHKQDIWWISDEDDIVIDDNKLTELTKLFANITSHYLDHDLGHLRCGRTTFEKGSIHFEDLCSLTDLVSGAFVDLFTDYENQGSISSTGLIIPAPKKTKSKVNLIGGWLADSSPKNRLKKICLMLNPGENNGIQISHINFHNLYDYAPNIKK